MLLEKYVRGEAFRSLPQASTITKRPAGAPAPLAPSQERILRRERQVPEIPPLYNESVTIYRFGALDIDALEQAFTEVIRRHEIWRTTYTTVNGTAVQVVHPAPEHIPIPFIDQRTVPEHRRLADTVRLISENARRPFDMEKGPLVRASLVRFYDGEFRLYLIVHQSVLDGVSVYQVLLTELSALYDAFSTGKPLPLTEPSIQFGDYAYWQRQNLQGETLQRQLTYWRTQLCGDLPALAWPTTKPRPAKQSFRGAIQPFAFPKAVGDRAKSLSQQMGVTLFTTLLAAFVVLLHIYTKQVDFIVGTVSPVGRKRSEVQNLIGYFLNPVALRFWIGDGPTFQDLLFRVQEVVAGALTHDDVPFEYLAEELQPSSDPSRNPFFTVAASLEPPLADVGPHWSLTPMDVESGGARWDLYFVWDNRPSGMIGRVQYNPDLFECEEITSLIADFQEVLEKLASNPGEKVSNLRLESSHCSAASI